MTDAKSTNKRGVLVVIVIIAIAVIGGLVSVSYWDARSKNSPGVDAAGSIPFDPTKAKAQLQATEQIVNDAIAAKGYDNAVNAAERFVEQYPKYAPARRLMAQSFFAAGKLEQGLAQAKLSLELNARQPDVHELAGTAANQLGDLELAVHHYRSAVGLDQANSRYRLLLAQIYIKQNNFDEARRLCLEAVNINSDAHAGYATLSALFAKQGKMNLALDQIDRAIQRVPIKNRDIQIGYIRKKAALLRHARRPGDALTTLQSLAVRERAEPDVLDEIATCYAIMNRPRDAAVMYEQLLLVEPTRIDWAAGAARWRITAGDTDKAKAHIETMRRISPVEPRIAQLEKKLQ